MPHMNRPGITGVFLLMVSSLVAQSAGNPFELAYRTVVPRQTKTLQAADSSALMPFPGPSVDSVPAPAADQMPGVVHVKDSLDQPAAGNPFDRVPAVLNPGEIRKDTMTASAPELPADPVVRELLKPARGFQITYLLFSLLLLIFIVNVEQGYVRDMWRVISNENYSALQQRNQRSTMRQILTFMGYLVFVLQAGLFLFHLVRVLDLPSPWIQSLWAATMLVAGIYIVRHLVLRYLRWLFNRERQLALYAFDITIFNTMVGLVLLPLNVLLLFGPESMHRPLVILGLVTFGAAYGLRQLRWLAASRSWLASGLLLFFLYLCAVEILPLWAVAAVFW